jgi:tRNA dimethylallyltransferase
MVGGSGLYVDAVLKGFDEFPDIEDGVRTEINSKFDALGIEFLQHKLQELDPNYYNKLGKENPQTLQHPQRMKRFVEVCIGTGKPYSTFINQKKNQREFASILIGLEAKREIIYDRINQRVDLMMNEGLLDEANKVYPLKDLNALQTVGYKELFSYFNNEISLEFAIEEIKKNTRRFAKRQLTWFKRNQETRWFEYDVKKEEIIEYINNKL